MWFFYDQQGNRVGMADSSNHIYYYLYNLQGDVIALADAETGKLAATYTYDAWGKIVSVKNASGYTIGTANPFRYRGYYYDNETGLYYLNSRYYNPEIGRFLNADAFASTDITDVLSANMFAYCENNPVNMVDPNGNWPKWIEDAANWVNDNIIQPAVNFAEDIIEDCKNYDRYNESEEKVLESNYFSSYKGTPVLRTDGDRSGSFGAIFLTRETNDRNNPEYIIRHEYGHTKQLKQLGVINYALCIGLPSWQQWGTGEYYSKPWEITADIYGGVKSRNHLQGDIDAGFAYLEASKTIGPFVWIFID